MLFKFRLLNMFICQSETNEINYSYSNNNTDNC